MTPARGLAAPWRPATCALLIVLVAGANLLATVEAINANDARLVIFPDAPTVRKPERKPLALTCRGDNAEPTLFSDLKWFDQHGELIDHRYHNPNIHSFLESDRLLLQFDNPTRNDGGRYRCEGRFQETEKFTKEVDVIFYQDITFEDCPVRQALVKGTRDATIRCSISAQPAPIITWRKDQRSVSDNRRYVITANGITIADTVNDEDAGRYYVKARVEQTGETIPMTITVEVHGKRTRFRLRSSLHPTSSRSPRVHLIARFLLGHFELLPSLLPSLFRPLFFDRSRDHAAITPANTHCPTASCTKIYPPNLVVPFCAAPIRSA